MSKTHKLDFLIALYIFCIAASEWMGAKTLYGTPFLDKLSLSLGAANC